MQYRYQVKANRRGTEVTNPKWRIFQNGEIYEVYDNKEDAVERARYYARVDEGILEIFDMRGRMQDSHVYH